MLIHFGLTSVHKKFLQNCVGGGVAVVVVVVIVVLFVPFEASPEQFWYPELLGGFLGASEATRIDG